MITGIGVHDRPESVFRINWIGCSRSNGISVHDPPERARHDGSETNAPRWDVALRGDEAARWFWPRAGNDAPSSPCLTWGVSGQAHSFALVAGVSPAKRGEAQRSRERSDLDAPATGYTVTSERAPARSWLPLWSLSRSFILALRISFCVWIRSVSPSFACSLDGRITSHPVELGRGSDHNPSCSRASGSGWRGPSC